MKSPILIILILLFVSGCSKPTPLTDDQAAKECKKWGDYGDAYLKYLHDKFPGAKRFDPPYSINKSTKLMTDVFRMDLENVPYFPIEPENVSDFVKSPKVIGSGPLKGYRTFEGQAYSRWTTETGSYNEMTWKIYCYVPSQESEKTLMKWFARSYDYEIDGGYNAWGEPQEVRYPYFSFWAHIGGSWINPFVDSSPENNPDISKPDKSNDPKS